jgi:hypothetical protein
LLAGQISDVDFLGEDLSALALDQADRLGEVFGSGREIAIVFGDRSACVDRDDIGAGAGQPDAV